MDEITRKKALQKARWTKRSVLAGISAIVLIIAVTAVWMLVEISQKRVYHSYEYITQDNIEN